MPLLQAGFFVVPHGGGLYAERLADEFGLYSDDVQLLGCAAWRAVRLAVDSGLHARGWSRARAREFALAHSPMPEDFIDAEIDRYIALPGRRWVISSGNARSCGCATKPGPGSEPG